MNRLAWWLCGILLSCAVAAAIWGGQKGFREGRMALFLARLKSPTMLLFCGYLLIASLVLPISPGESASPLFGLSLLIPSLYALASLAALGFKTPTLKMRLALALLFFAATLASGVIVLALLSPNFVPPMFR